jgi:predicted enzyme related to lactoylglutathione lyase
MQLRQIFVALADSEAKLVPFYQQLFELEPSVWSPQYAEFELPGLKLGIFKPKADQQQQFQGAGGISLCLEVEQLEQAIEQLTEMGYAPPEEIMAASHGREVYAYDPTGNRLILHESVK